VKEDIRRFEFDQLIFIKTACQNTRLAGHSSAVLPFYVFDSKTSCRPPLSNTVCLDLWEIFFTHYCNAEYQNAVCYQVVAVFKIHCRFNINQW